MSVWHSVGRYSEVMEMVPAWHFIIMPSRTIFLWAWRFGKSHSCSMASMQEVWWGRKLLSPGSSLEQWCLECSKGTIQNSHISYCLSWGFARENLGFCWSWSSRVVAWNCLGISQGHGHEFGKLLSPSAELWRDWVLGDSWVRLAPFYNHCLASVM